MKYLAALRPRKAQLLLAHEAPFHTKPARNQSFRRGQLYENACARRLEAQYGAQALCGPWFRWHTDASQGYSQMDALVFDITKGNIYVIEIKLGHTRQAYRQLRNHYLPVLEALGWKAPLFNLVPVEICSNYDRNEDQHIAAKIEIIKDLRQAQPHQLNVLIWRYGYTGMQL